VAPAWSMPPWLLPVLAEQGFRFTEDHFRVYDPAARRARASVVLNWATRTPGRLVSSLAFCRAAKHAAAEIEQLVDGRGDVLAIAEIIAEIDKTVAAKEALTDQIMDPGKPLGLAMHGTDRPNPAGISQFSESVTGAACNHLPRPGGAPSWPALRRRPAHRPPAHAGRSTARRAVCLNRRGRRALFPIPC